METAACLILRRLSILAILLMLFTAVLSAQVNIKSRVEIAPKTQIVPQKSIGLTPGFTCTVPFSGNGGIVIVGFDNMFSGHARITMNGITVVEDVYDLVFYYHTIHVDLGHFKAGDILDFQLIDPENGFAMAAQECWNYLSNCVATHSLYFTYVPICGESFEDSGPTNLDCLIQFSNEAEIAKRIFTPIGGGDIYFKESIILEARYESVCGSMIDLPAGTTFTFTITQGQEHAVLNDIYSGKEGPSLSGIPSEYGPSGFIRLKTIGDEPSQPVDVTIDIHSTVPNVHPSQFHVTILPNDLKIIPTKTVITYGDTLRFDVWKKLSETTYGPCDPEMRYSYYVVEGYNTGYLFSPDMSQAELEFLSGDFSSSIFAAYENTPQGQSTLMKLRVIAQPPNVPCPDCPATSITQNNLSPATKGPMLKRSTGGTNDPRQLNKTDLIPIEKNIGTSSPSWSTNKLDPYSMMFGPTTPNLKNLQKNANGSFSYINRDSTGARITINRSGRQQTENSKETVLKKNADGGYSPEKNNQLAPNTGSGDRNNPYGPNTLVGIVTIEVVKPSEILLGETKYYTAKPDPDQLSHLIITESFAPDLGDGDERVVFEDPQIADDAVNNDAVGVSWGFSGSDNSGLNNGVIRLTGRYWNPVTVYKVKLHAVLKELGREGAIEIVVKPGCIHAAFEKTPLSVGETTKLIFTYSGTDIPVPEGCLLDISILNTDNNKGSLLSSTNTSGEILNNAAQPIKYIAPSTISGNSMAINIKTVASEASGASASIKGKSPDSTNINVIKTKRQVDTSIVKSIQGVNGKPSISQPLSPPMLKFLEGPVCEFEAGDVIINDILLGETKYYYVRNANGKITLEETIDPINTTDKATDAIWGANPVTIVTENITIPGKRLGVYWEIGKPIPEGGELTNDMIRLVGRYWHTDSVYKVALNITYDSKELKKIIEVKKPTKLINREEVKGLSDFRKGNDYSQTIDVRGHPLDIDALVIEIAGTEGIPPQIIKSHMYQESDKTPNSVTDNPQFNPSYRYEPWTEIFFRKRYNEKDKWGRRKNDFLDQPFVVETGSMGLGKTVPDHQGVKPIDYEDNPISLGSYVVREWSKYVTNEKFIKAPDDLNEWWKNLKKYYKEVFLKQYTENEATTRASNEALIEIQSVLQTVHTEWAQTRKCASYGFTQLMYETARLMGYNKQYSRDNFNLWDRPEDLNDHIIAMPFYKKVMRTNLKSLFNKGVPESGWSEGFEKTWEKAIQLYNKDSDNYGKEVLLNSKKFLPISDKVTS